MKQELSTSECINLLMQDEYANWTYGGAKAIVEYLEQLEEDLGESIELDVVAIRCEFSEYVSLYDWAIQYWGGEKEAFDSMGIERGEDMDRENRAIEEYIYDNGVLIEFDSGIIVSNF